ncbi:Uu.00g043750.m01.CDS01 [Anthostomella pinea]|uniref:Uu.00g043750.m01.CDS01 n=1 Tax=Anthostomella pinea TaxID=933095 RepID=A0AAI8VBI6_9PEZI|nr:Uu.00g043750.m01.CDS01 [Anthostomella pinea]
MADFSKIPSTATLQPKPFKAHVDEQKLQNMKDLLKLSPVGPAVWENTSKDQGETLLSNPARVHGMRRDWLESAKDQWLNQFDWRKHEDHINSFPNFTVPVTGDDGVTIDMHFMALFSEKQDAVPIVFTHGWPGSFLEFLKLFGLLKERYSPKDLPYHVVAPSLPGYGYSSGPPVDVDYTTDKASDVVGKLMAGLGFESGYLAQGGDLGSFVSRYLALNHDACKGMHLNMFAIGPPEDEEKKKQMSEIEAKALPRGEAFRANGQAYAIEHGTRTATIGLALSASPLAMLAWIGEKFLEWTDTDPSVDEILESISLYWLTDTFPRCIYPYRALISGKRPSQDYVEKPSGYSFFPRELNPVPRSWAEASCNLVSYSGHSSGGHFAAMEHPNELLADVEEYVKKAWKGLKSLELSRLYSLSV